jgi:hypothetical protein
MKAIARIESDLDPKQRTGSYLGLFQLSKDEFAQYGSGDILDARDNALTAANKFAIEDMLLELSTHKKATFSDLSDPSARNAGRGGTRQSSRQNCLEINARHRRGQRKGREVVQASDLGKYAS